MHEDRSCLPQLTATRLGGFDATESYAPVFLHGTGSENRGRCSTLQRTGYIPQFLRRNPISSIIDIQSFNSKHYVGTPTSLLPFPMRAGFFL